MATIHKALDVLFFLTGQRRACGVSEVAYGLGLPKTTAHRLLTDLRYRNLVEQDDRGDYRLGLGLVALGLGVTRQDPLLAHAKPHMRQAAAELGQPVFFVGERGGELVVLDKVEGEGAVRLSPQIGGRIPVHRTAVGRVYLAHCPHVLHEPWPPSITRSDVDTVLAEVRARGWAVSHEEWLEGLIAVAAGVWIHGQLCGVLATACMTSRAAEEAIENMAAVVVTTAHQITRKITEECHEGVD